MMSLRNHSFVGTLLLGVAGLALAGGGAPLAGADWGFDPTVIESTLGLKGTRIEAEKVFKVAVPRQDVAVWIDGWKMPPFMGLTSWAAFKAGTEAEAMVMGDLVLFEDEVNAVMSAALDHGLTVTALHNHFFFDQPRVYFMHIGGEGAPAVLAAGVKAAFDAIAKTRSAHPEPALRFGSQDLPAASAISAAPVETAIGAKAIQNAGMLKFVFGRQASMACGCTVGKEMGVNTWAAFAGTDDNALVDGDFVATAGELQGVLKSLRHDGINIVAIHSHMADEEPRMIFLHYWGRGRAADLAKSVKRALATQHL